MSEKGMSKKDKLIAETKHVISQYDTRLTLRQIYYRLVSAHIIKNSMNEYKYLSKVLVDARLNRQVPFRAIEDRTRGAVGGDVELQDPDESIGRAIRRVKEAYRYYSVPHWLNQDTYVEVWLEKEALSGIFSGVTDGESVTLCTCRGYPSLTFMYEAYARLSNIADGRQIQILYFGDFDPSGEDIYRHVKDMFDTFGISAEFEKIAITQDQIKKYNIPPMPTKRSDARSAGFIAEHGDIAVELDALDPDVLEKLIEDSITDYFDDDIYTETMKKQKEDRDYIMTEIRKRVAEGIFDDDEGDEEGEEEGDDDDEIE